MCFPFLLELALKKEKDLQFKVRQETPLRIKEGQNYFLKQILQFL